MVKKIRNRYRRFKFNNQPYFPGLFFTLEMALSSSKMLAMGVVFFAIFYSVH